MNDPSRKRLRRTTIIYWTLLLYVIAALVWWFISLEKQNQEMADLQFQNLVPGSPGYEEAKLLIEEGLRRNTLKYVGEGITFLILIVIGAIFLYRSVKGQFSVQLQQQNFMMAITHELKTPLSVARLNLETIQKYNLEPEKQDKLIRMTLEEISRLNSLTNNILISSQLEGGGYKNTREELDLSDLLKDCIQDYRNRYPERVFSEDIDQDADVLGDPLLLQMLINNLLENAIKYSPKAKPITARLKKHPASIELQVSDEGAGIPDEEKKKIFDRFYRVGNETTRKSQGTGLGLYLCRTIARAHNADISVTNNIPTGSTFVITFIPGS